MISSVLDAGACGAGALGALAFVWAMVLIAWDEIG